MPAVTRAGGLRPLISFLDAVGAPVSRLLRATHLDPDLLEVPRALIPLPLVYRFIETCASSQGIENLGAAVAARTSAFDLTVLGPSLRRAATVYDYLRIGGRVIGEMTTGERVWLTFERDRVRFHHLAPGRPCIASSHEDVFVILVTIRMLRAFAGRAWTPGEVRLMAADARRVGDLELFGDAALHFGEPHSSFTIPFDLLQARVAAPLDHLRAEPEDLSPVRPAIPDTFVEGIETLVDSMLNAGSLSVETVAEGAGLSTRTLQRRLRYHGVSYSDIVHRSRLRLAREWLADTAIPVREIALALGYSDPANFTRAFRRATGVPPRHYRLLH